MKAIWITPGYPWPGRPYAGIFFQTQAQALSRLGVELAVVAAVPWIPRLAGLLSPRHALLRAAPREDLDGQIQVFRVEYFGNRFSPYLGWPHLGAARAILKRLPFRPDVVHAHFAYPQGLAAVEVARRLGVPSVLTLHGSDVNILPTLSSLSARRFQRAAAGADQVLCVSRALGERTRQLTGIAARCLPIGVNLKRFGAGRSRAQAREALDLPQDRAVVLFIGNVIAEKGVAVALEALAHPGLAGTVGVFVGTGDMGPAVAGQSNCLWRGGVDNSLIPDYLAAADLVILPSFGEGLPTVLVEAGACGVPVIATDVGGIPELLGRDRGILVAPGSADALRTAIQLTLAEPGAAQARADALRLHVLEAYDADRNARELLGIYGDLVKLRAR